MNDKLKCMIQSIQYEIEISTYSHKPNSSTYVFLPKMFIENGYLFSKEITITIFYRFFNILNSYQHEPTCYIGGTST